MIELQWRECVEPERGFQLAPDCNGREYALQYRQSKSKIVPSPISARDDLLVPNGAWGDWIDVPIEE